MAADLVPPADHDGLVEGFLDEVARLGRAETSQVVHEGRELPAPHAQRHEIKTSSNPRRLTSAGRQLSNKDEHTIPPDDISGELGGSTIVRKDSGPQHRFRPLTRDLRAGAKDALRSAEAIFRITGECVTRSRENILAPTVASNPRCVWSLRGRRRNKHGGFEVVR